MKNGLLYMRKQLVALLTICVLIICVFPSYAEESCFSQDNIVQIKCMTSTDAEVDGSVLYNKDNDSQLGTIEVPAETYGFEVSFEDNLNLKINNKNAWVMLASDYEELQGNIRDYNESSSTKLTFNTYYGKQYSVVPYQVKAGTINTIDMDGLYLDYDKEYVVLVSKLQDNTNQKYSVSSNMYLNGDSSWNYNVLFKIRTESRPDVIPEGYDETNPIKIDSAQALYEIRNHENWENKCYVLTDDIDMEDLRNLDYLNDNESGETVFKGYSAPNEYFAGVLDGKDPVTKKIHTIKNFSYENKNVINYGAGLFCGIGSDVRNQCCVKNIKFMDVAMGNEQESITRSGGVVAGNATRSVTLSNVEISASPGKKNTIYTESTFGSLIGSSSLLGNCVVDNCSVSNEKVFITGGNDYSGGMFGALFVMTRSYSFFTPLKTIKNCNVSDIIFDINSSQIVGGFAGNIGNGIINDCKVEKISMRLNYPVSYSIPTGGAIGYVTKGVINGFTVDDVKFLLNNNQASSNIGGFSGKNGGENDCSKIKICNVKVAKNDGIAISNENKITVGGLTGLLSTTSDLTIGCKIEDVVIRDFIIENFDSADKSMYTAGVIGSIEKEGKYFNLTIKNVFVDMNLNTYYNKTGQSGEILNNKINDIIPNLSNYALTIENTNYNADNGNESNGNLGQLFELSSIADNESSSIAPSIPVTFELTGDQEKMSNKTSDQVEVKAYGLKEKEGSAEAPEYEKYLLEDFMDTFGTVVKAENWRIVPYSADAQESDPMSSEGITAENTTIAVDTENPLKAVVSSTYKGEPATVVAAAEINGNTKYLEILYNYKPEINAVYENVPTDSVQVGQTFTSDVVLTSEVDLAAAELDLAADGTYAKIVKIEGAVSNFSSNVAPDGKSAKISFYGNTASVTEGLKVATVTFEAVSEGSAELSMTAGSAGQEGETGEFDITLPTVSAVTVIEAPLAAVEYGGNYKLMKYEPAAGTAYTYDGKAMYVKDGAFYCVVATGAEGNRALVAAAESGTAYNDVAKGDINESGVINIIDAQIAYDIASNIYSGFEKLTSDQIVKADVNNDLQITSADARAIQYYVHTGGFTA